jgi:hypothetical protein
MTKEDEIQKAVITVLIKNRYLVFAVPNGGARNIGTAKVLKATGTLAGVSDIIIVRNGVIDFVEIKTPTGLQRTKQKVFQHLIKSFGFNYYVWRSVEDCKAYIDNNKFKISESSNELLKLIYSNDSDETIKNILTRLIGN